MGGRAGGEDRSGGGGPAGEGPGNRSPAGQASGHHAGSREEAFRRLLAQAMDAWGPERASAIEAILRRTSDSIWKLERLEFRSDDRPGFFLSDLAAGDSGSDRPQ